MTALLGRLPRKKFTTDKCWKFGEAPAKSRMSRPLVGVLIVVKTPVPVGSVKFSSTFANIVTLPARPEAGLRATTAARRKAVIATLTVARREAGPKLKIEVIA